MLTFYGYHTTHSIAGCTRLSKELCRYHCQQSIVSGKILAWCTTAWYGYFLFFFPEKLTKVCPHPYLVCVIQVHSDYILITFKHYSYGLCLCVNAMHTPH